MHVTSELPLNDFCKSLLSYLNLGAGGVQASILHLSCIPSCDTVHTTSWIMFGFQIVTSKMPSPLKYQCSHIFLLAIDGFTDYFFLEEASHELKT